MYVYRSSGIYFGFISNGYLYSRDGVYLGWLDGNYVWDSSGQFRGVLTNLSQNHYILRNKFMLLPVPRIPKQASVQVTPPNPVPNIQPITLPVELSDAF